MNIVYDAADVGYDNPQVTYLGHVYDLDAPCYVVTVPAESRTVAVAAEPRVVEVACR